MKVAQTESNRMDGNKYSFFFFLLKESESWDSTKGKEIDDYDNLVLIC